jgi:hypothetical protein
MQHEERRGSGMRHGTRQHRGCTRARHAPVQKPESSSAVHASQLEMRNTSSALVAFTRADAGDTTAASAAAPSSSAYDESPRAMSTGVLAIPRQRVEGQGRRQRRARVTRPQQQQRVRATTSGSRAPSKRKPRRV